MKRNYDFSFGTANNYSSPGYSASLSSHSASLSSCSDMSISSQSSTLESGNSRQVTALKRIISSDIAIVPAQKKQNKEIIESFRDAIIAALKTSSSLFDNLYRNTYPTGSSYEGLRIKDPNEFDIDLVLSLPFKNYKIDPVRKKSGFASYKLDNNWNKVCHDQKLCSLILEIDKNLVEDNYIMPAKVRSWMQSIIDKINVQSFKVNHVVSISISQSGPARTFKLHSFFDGKPYEVSVDLVPVIMIPFSEAPTGCVKLVATTYNVPHHLLFLFMVPKEYDGTHCAKDSIIGKRLFRLHFPGIEKHLIHNRGCVKPVIKLLKLLRDNEKWYVLSSYALKTVVISRVLENPSIDYWNEAYMPLRFMEALDRLSEYLSRKDFGHIFFDDNLLQKVEPDSITIIYNRLQKIIAHLKRDFTNNIVKYFPPKIMYLV